MDNIHTLLAEYWRGTLDLERQQEVEAWIEASQENRQTALRYCRLEQYVTEYTLKQIEDEAELVLQADFITDADPSARKEKNAPKKNLRPSSFGRKRWPWVVSVAAVLTMVVIGGWLSLRHPAGNVQEAELSFQTTSGEVAQYVLPDGTKVWLNSNTTLRYPEAFAHRTRKVWLEGEAFFDVTRDEEHPFIVQTRCCRVKVLGTQFDVEAYPDYGSNFYTTLVSGSVEMSLRTGGRNRSAILVPGQRFSYNTENDLAGVSYVDTESLTSWRTGCITFYHTSLKDVLTLIGNTFGIRFIINNTSILNDTYTGTFDHQPLEEILSTLEQVTDLNFNPLALTEEEVYPRYIVY